MLALVAASRAASGQESDVSIQLLTLSAPSAVASTADLSDVPSQGMIYQPGQSFVLEIWATDAGALNTGIVGLYVDLLFDPSVVSVSSLQHGPGAFSVLPEGIIDNVAGEIRNFGGVDGSFQGQGLAPQWTRVAYATFSVQGSGSTLITASLGAGGVGVLGRTPPATEAVAFGSAFVSSGDCNRNGSADAQDIGAMASLDCNQNQVPDECEPPGCLSGVVGDLTCDGKANGADIQPFTARFAAGQYTCQADFNHDAAIDEIDMQEFVLLLLVP